MNLKEELKKLKNKLLVRKENNQSNKENNEHSYKVLATHEEMKKMREQYDIAEDEAFLKLVPDSLNDKVDEFINWYTNIYEELFDNEPEEVRNFIEKMAIWYELRYPNYSVIDMLYDEKIQCYNNRMFNENPYINKTNEELDILLDNNKSKEAFDYLEWDKFYNTKAFINSLPEDEKNLLSKPKYYRWCVYRGVTLYLTSKGIIDRVSSYYHNPHITFPYCQLKGKHIKEAVTILKKEVPHRDAYELMKRINDYDNHCKFKEGLLDSVMYRIMEREKNRIGAYRAFLFAKEFNRNIDIPLQYGISRIDSDLKNFISDYLEAGGSKNLVCYRNYYSRENRFEKLQTITINEIINMYYRDWYEQFTKEEIIVDNKKELEQRLVNVLAGFVDKEELEQEKVKQLRIERRLQRNKK